MNRIKLWVFSLLVVAAGYVAVRSEAVTRRAEVVASMDARLASASSHVTRALAAAGREAALAAVLVARDDGLVGALHPSEPPPAATAAKGKKPKGPPPLPRKVDPKELEAKVREVAPAALERVEKAYGIDLPPGTVVSATTRDLIAMSGEPTAQEADETAFLRGAANGQVRRGPVRKGGKLYYGASRPAGEGAGVVLLIPLDDSWSKGLATAAGTDVTVTVPDVKPLSTARPSDLAALQGVTKLAGAGDAGTPRGVEVEVGPVKVPPLPQPFAGGAPLRARAVAIDGVKGGFVVLSIPAAAAVNAPAVFHWLAVLGLAVVFLVGLVLGFFVRSSEAAPQVPEPLYAAAARIEKGDFAARAPTLAGKLGTIAAALNRAAEIAGPAEAAKGAPDAPSWTQEWFQHGAPAAPQELRIPAASGMGTAPAPRAAAAPAPAAAPASLSAAPASALAPAIAPAPTPAIELDEESHWQQVYKDFLKTRTSCGESAEGLTYEKFRQKLEGNKAQLVAKYACKTVRFQVYVKDGKAALKATPVK